MFRNEFVVVVLMLHTKFFVKFSECKRDTYFSVPNTEVQDQIIEQAKNKTE